MNTAICAQALRSAARKAGDPLALAAAATAVGFFAFLPTSYRGLSEFGLIAGCGMLIAFVCSITLVPAMLAMLNPPGETEAVGFKGLAPLDDFLQRHRIAVIAGTILLVLAGAPLLLHLPFDFNPVNLQSPTSASVVTYRQLQRDPETSGNDAEILAPSLEQADAIAKRLAALPEVSRTLTLNSFIPADQDQKIAALKAARAASAPRSILRDSSPRPSDQEVVAAIQSAAAALSRVAGERNGAAADAARHVSGLLQRLAGADAGIRGKAAAAFVPPLSLRSRPVRKSLAPQTVTIKTLPPTWSAIGYCRTAGRAFRRSQRAIPTTPTCCENSRPRCFAPSHRRPGAAISYYESGKAVTAAFIEAGILALVAIAILLFIALRRVRDVLLTLIPLLLAGAVTLEICVLDGFALNFANIIALPLLLGVGVAFKIYYIMAWRAGKTGLLQSTLTRAVIFSAMTNAVAFGSMWASSYPGMSSMGKMMALSLLCTLAAAVLFQPVLMGRPRQAEPVRNPPRSCPRPPNSVEPSSD